MYPEAPATTAIFPLSLLDPPPAVSSAKKGIAGRAEDVVDTTPLVLVGANAHDVDGDKATVMIAMQALIILIEDCSTTPPQTLMPSLAFPRQPDEWIEKEKDIFKLKICR